MIDMEKIHQGNAMHSDASLKKKQHSSFHGRKQEYWNILNDKCCFKVDRDSDQQYFVL